MPEKEPIIVYRTQSVIDFVGELEDGTLNYQISIIDKEHFDKPVTLVLSLLNGVPVLCERWEDSIEAHKEH